MTDERVLLGLVDAMKRIENKNRKRGYATFWHAENEFQGLMEMGAVTDWAEAINRRAYQIDINTIRKNIEPYPDCLAEMNGEKIGVEVTELVCEEAIEAYPEIPRLEDPGPHFLDQLASLPRPPIFIQWTLHAFQEYLDKIVQKKDKRVKDRSLSKQFLLIVTDEDWLDEATLI